MSSKTIQAIADRAPSPQSHHLGYPNSHLKLLPFGDDPETVYFTDGNAFIKVHEDDYIFDVENIR